MSEDFNSLYAKVFYAGVYQHAEEVQKVADNPERDLLGQSRLLDCCYHAGAAVEQLVCGLLIENDELNRLWVKPFGEGNCFALPFHSSKDEQMGIIGHRTRPIGSIIHEQKGEEAQIDFAGNAIHEVDDLLNMRNKAVHENLLIGGVDDLICKFGLFRDYARRQFDMSDDALKAIYPTRGENPFIHAERDLFQEWLSFHRERYVEKRNEDAVSERSRLQIEKRRIRKRWDDYRSEWHDEDPIRSSCCIGVCKCPICGENTTYSVLAGKYYTYWSGDPNNSPSVLYCPEEKHLECMCCIAKDEEAMHWTNLEIRNYRIMHGSLPEDKNLTSLTFNRPRNLPGFVPRNGN